MKMNKLAVVIGTVMALSTGAASASGGDASGASTITVNGGTVHFKGKLVAAPCVVSDDTSDQTVKLGEYTTHHFAKKGVAGMIKPFEIKLEDCDTSTASIASVAFSGIADATDPTLLAINQDDSTSGSATTATGVAIKIMDNASKIVKLDGSGFTDNTTILNGDSTPALKFTAQYVSVQDGATGGDANADVNFIMKYQ